MTTLAEEQDSGAEAALWAAMRALEEKAALSTRLAQTTQNKQTVDRLREQAQADRSYAEVIRKMVFGDERDEEAKSA